MSEETLEEARQKDRLGREIEVLILVKTTPTPSTTYEDTVCVAGIALAPGPPRWVRLYPIPFRHLDSETQFAKYEVVAVKVGQPSNDPRAESLRVDVSTIRSVRKLDSWVDRIAVILNMEPTTACALNTGTRADPNATSLGIMRPHAVELEVKPHAGWTPKQRRVLNEWAHKVTLPLDGLRHDAAPPLELPPLEAWYRYKCEAQDCKGHRQGILDWELTALQLRARKSGADIERWVRNNFYDRMFAPQRQPWLILGNNAAGNKRSSFSVLSVFYPKEADVSKWLFMRDRLF